MIEVSVRFRRGAFALEADCRSRDRTTGVLGPSGAGKSTLLALIGGLLTPACGRIVLGDRVLFDSGRGIDVPVRQRGLGHVFQEGRLFPHLSVRQNLLYGRRFGGIRGAHPTLDEVVDLLDIGPLLSRLPRGLSGGEHQRVALGRALLAGPAGLLMDEPLAALDPARRREILPYLERLARDAGVPILYVSHAHDEVARLAATTILLEDGRVTAAGPTAAVLARADARPPGVFAPAQSDAPRALAASQSS